MSSSYGFMYVLCSWFNSEFLSGIFCRTFCVKDISAEGMLFSKTSMQELLKRLSNAPNYVTFLEFFTTGNQNDIVWASVTCFSLTETLCLHVLSVVTSSADCVIDKKSCVQTISFYLGTHYLMGLYCPTLSYYMNFGNVYW